MQQERRHKPYFVHHPDHDVCFAAGTSMALVGVFLYSQAKRLYGKKGSGGGGSD